MQAVVAVKRALKGSFISSRSGRAAYAERLVSRQRLPGWHRCRSEQPAQRESVGAMTRVCCSRYAVFTPLPGLPASQGRGIWCQQPPQGRELVFGTFACAFVFPLYRQFGAVFELPRAALLPQLLFLLQVGGG